MAFYGDPAELERCARRVRDHAREVRDRATRGRLAAHAAPWQSAARERFIDEVDERMRALHRAAELLEEAAGQLDEQARALRDALAEIAAMQAAVIAWVARAKAEVERAAVRGAASALATGGRLELPAPGDRGWLEVAHDLRRAGVCL